jgi:iron complex transport system substrate-binding protein
MDAKITLAGFAKTGIVALAAVISLTACAQPDLEDAESEEASRIHRIDHGPRFVSLNPCTDAILVAVADNSQIQALSHYSQDPRSSSILPNVASQFAVTGGTAEEVVALGPDIVLAGAFIQPATRQSFADLGLQVETFGIASDIETSFDQIRKVAKLTGHQHRGEALIDKIEASLVLHSAKPDDPEISAVLWQPGQIVPGQRTLIAQLMERAGFASHSAAQGLGQADYLTLEQLIDAPPQVLLVAGNARGQNHPALRKLAGTRVETFDPGLLYCGGPTIIRAMERLGTIRKAQV